RSRNPPERAERLVMNLSDFHRESENKNAFLYNQLLHFDMKQSSYEEQIAELKALSKRYPEAWYTSEVLLKLTSKYKNRVFRLASNEEKRMHLDSVLAIGRLMEARYDSTTAHVDLQESLIRSILSSSLSVQAQRYNVPDKPIPIWISHKNLDK